MMMGGACCCSLAGTEACFRCPNRMGQSNVYTPIPFIYPAKIKRTIEEFDKDGKVTKRITEED